MTAIKYIILCPFPHFHFLKCWLKKKRNISSPRICICNYLRYWIHSNSLCRYMQFIWRVFLLPVSKPSVSDLFYDVMHHYSLAFLLLPVQELLASADHWSGSKETWQTCLWMKSLPLPPKHRFLTRWANLLLLLTLTILDILFYKLVSTQNNT